MIKIVVADDNEVLLEQSVKGLKQSEEIEIAKDFENPPDFIVITGGASSEIMKKLYSLPVRNIFNKPLEIQRIIDEIENTKVVEIPKEKIKTLAEEKSLLGKLKKFFYK